MNLQMLTTEQHSNIGSSLAGHDELMLNLQLNVFRHPFFPESAAVDPGGFAFEDLNVRCADDFPVDIGQHPVQTWIGMLKDCIDPTHTIAGTPGVVRCHDGFKDVPPISRALLIERISLGQQAITASFFQPEFELGFVGIETDSGSGIGTADALPADIEPIFPRQGFGADQPQSRPT
jgi:hypothetical protein